MNFREIPLNKLKLSPRNMRQGDVPIADLVAGFKARNTVLQNLRVTEEVGKRNKPTGHFLVHVGGRRLRAALAMVESKLWAPDTLIPCMVCLSEADALEESVLENMHRLDPHPAQRFKAFKALLDEGRTVADIAERFDVPEVVVRQRMKLACVSPKLFELFENGEISLDQMQAFTLTDDHTAQENAYFGHHWTQPYEIRKRLTAGEVETQGNALLAYVGVDAYEAAGGAIRQDLFSQPGGGYIANIDVLDRIASEKLQHEADALSSEGWSWVEARQKFGYADRSAFKVIDPEPMDLSPEAAARFDELEADRAAYDDTDELSDDELEALERLDEEIRSLQGPRAFTPAQLALAGAVVYLGSNGEVNIARGLVRPDDLKIIEAQTVTAPDSPNSVKTPDSLSSALVENLTAHRTLALRARLQDEPHSTLILTTQRLALTVFFKPLTGPAPKTALEISGIDCGLDPLRFGDDLIESKAALAIEARRSEVRSLLPENADDLLDHLINLPHDDLLRVFSYCVSQQLYAVQSRHAGSSSADPIAAMLGLDMADWWEADATFFARISKDQITTAISEVGARVSAEQAKLKKAQLADLASRTVAGKRWLPAILKAAAEDAPEPEANELGGDQGDDGAAALAPDLADAA